MNKIPPFPQEKFKDGDEFLDFLKSYYLAVWDSIRHKEDNIWRFVSFVAVGLGALIGLSIRIRLAIEVLIIFLYFISFWGVMVVIDANLWFRRNIYIVNNCERFLFRNLKPQILRTHYFRDPVRWETMYRIHFLIFYLFSIAGLILYIYNSFIINEILTQNKLIGYCLFYFLLIFLIHWFKNMKDEEYFNFVKACKPFPVKGQDGSIIESTEFSLPSDYFRYLTMDFFDRGLIFEITIFLPAIVVFLFYFNKYKFTFFNSWLLLILSFINLFLFVFILIKKSRSINKIDKLKNDANIAKSPIKDHIIKKEKIWDEVIIYKMLRYSILINLAIFIGLLIINLFNN